MPEPVVRQSGRHVVRSIIGWTSFLLVLAAIIYIGAKTADYYGKIKRGEIVDLPQFREQFTSGKDAVISPDSVPRSAVETADAPAVGADASKAALTIVEFADFQCPYSKDVSSVVRTIAARYGDKVRVEFRQYPLSDIHPEAKEAALAATCADEQGRFWAYHDKLFEGSPALGTADLLRYAGEVGLDAAQFQKCLVDARYEKKVDADVAAAAQLGVAGTPVFYFNGQRVEGAIPETTFEQVVQRMAP